MSDYVIERLKAEDWQKYRKLRLNALLEEPTAFSTLFEEERNLSEDEWIAKVGHFALSEKQRMFVAKLDDELVAMMGVMFDQRVKRSHIATVVSVYVAKPYRGQGISKRLMQATLDNLKQVEYINKVKLTVNPTQSSAIGLYKTFGFREVGKLKNELKIDDHFQDIMLMETWLETNGKGEKDTVPPPTDEPEPTAAKPFKQPGWLHFFTDKLKDKLRGR